MRCEQELLSNMSFVPFGDLLLEPLRNGLTKPKAVRGDGVKMIGMGEIFANSRIGAISMSRVPVTEKELSNNCIKNGDIKELLKTAEEINALRKEGEKLGLSEEELAFYDALTKPEHIKDFYENETLIALTRELTDMLRRNRTIDWQKKETARAGMRKMVKRLLKKYKYPPEKYEDAIETVMSQCELWTDQAEM